MAQAVIDSLPGVTIFTVHLCWDSDIFTTKLILLYVWYMLRIEDSEDQNRGFIILKNGIICSNSKCCRYASRDLLRMIMFQEHIYVKLQLFLSKGILECIIIHIFLLKSLFMPCNNSRIAEKTFECFCLKRKNIYCILILFDFSLW